NNLFKVVENKISKEYSEQRKNGNLSLICLGSKTVKHFKKHNYELDAEFPGFFEELKFHEAMEIMKHVISEFQGGAFDEVQLAYNEFKSVIAQNRIVESVLPINPKSLIADEDVKSNQSEYIYEPGVERILAKLLPLHLNLQLWRAILESNAAEQGARMTSMDNATENAKELQEDLQLEYNRARQSAITTEISEIISGAQALQEA
ncbi:MAG TPA: FoF1 ATP synthase subunit gamma, partial [Balneolaceae bacterium]|nr:FoF1 ATP synthase subunit gamma [Balneolaceae bacterium]